jgi:hypothetical protein
MKKNKTTISLVAKVIGGALFLAVFLFNVGSFVKKDAGGISITALRAYADDGEGGGEEVDDAYESRDEIETETKSTRINSAGKVCTKIKIATDIVCNGSGQLVCFPMHVESDWGPEECAQ